MSAIRLARGFTGRDTLIKFEGCYHGHADSLLVKAGSGALTLGIPTSPGVPADAARHTLTLEFNNADELREVFAQRGSEIAAVIVEPVTGNMNCIAPRPGFLEALREVCDQSGAVLIFDEVMTGFRGGARRCSGSLRGAARSHNTWESAGWGPAGRCVWWSSGHHVASGTAWSRLSGRHAVGESVGNVSRYSHTHQDLRRGIFSSGSQTSRRRWWTVFLMPRGRPVFPWRPSVSEACSAYFLPISQKSRLSLR